MAKATQANGHVASRKGKVQEKKSSVRVADAAHAAVNKGEQPVAKVVARPEGPGAAQGKQEQEPKSKFQHLLQDSLFAHLLVEEAAASAAMARRRAMMLVDVLVERGWESRLKKRWVFTSAIISLLYLRYVLPVYAAWGEKYLQRTMEASEYQNLVGGPHSQVSFGVLVAVTLLYLCMLHCSRRVMETRLPVSNIIFETLVVYNMTQMVLNSYVFVQLIGEARHLGFQYPWGNLFSYTEEGHRLGYYIWFHYHCCQLELIDTVFVVIRKKFKKITFLHVYLRLLNMWGWFFACRYACGGDAYFPAAVNAGTRAVVYAFYSLSMLTYRGIPFLRKARVTSVQMLQLALCAAHATYCLYAYWGMNFPRLVLLLYLLVMLQGLVLYTDFHFQVERKFKVAPAESATRKLSMSFDSSGWLYCYHFGVATWLKHHVLPEGMTCDDAPTSWPEELAFSGSSGGALASGVLSVGLDPSDVFEMVLAKYDDCRYNPFRMLPAAEEVMRKVLPPNSHKSLTGRLKVLLTRVSWKYPWFTAEVVNQFHSFEDVFHVLRATCHVPVIAGLLPYRHDGSFYLDGLLWPQMLVPWKGAHDDHMVRVSACSLPSSDIKPPIVPIWWVIFPPSVDALRGLFWMGYRDAGRWFTQSPQNSFACLACRRPMNCEGEGTGGEVPSMKRSVSDSDVPVGLGKRRRSRLSSSRSESRMEDMGEAEPEQDVDRATAWAAARKLMLREPPQGLLPEVDWRTGKSPRHFVAMCEEAIDLSRRRAITVVATLCILATALSLG